MGKQSTSIDQRVTLWHWIDTHHPELWDQPAPLQAPPDLIAEMVTVVAGTTRRQRVAAFQAVRRWLADPDAYSPVIDEVALKRAMAFEWDVIACLTPDETGELYRRLALMGDPLAEAEEDRNVVTGELISATPRRLAYLRASRTQQNTLRQGLTRARTKMLAEQGAAA